MIITTIDQLKSENGIKNILKLNNMDYKTTTKGMTPAAIKMRERDIKAWLITKEMLENPYTLSVVNATCQMLTDEWIK